MNKIMQKLKKYVGVSILTIAFVTPVMAQTNFSNPYITGFIGASAFGEVTQNCRKLGRGKTRIHRRY